MELNEYDWLQSPGGATIKQDCHQSKIIEGKWPRNSPLYWHTLRVAYHYNWFINLVFLKRFQTDTTQTRECDFYFKYFFNLKYWRFCFPIIVYPGRMHYSFTWKMVGPYPMWYIQRVRRGLSCYSNEIATLECDMRRTSSSLNQVRLGRIVSATVASCLTFIFQTCRPTRIWR